MSLQSVSSADQLIGKHQSCRGVIQKKWLSRLQRHHRRRCDCVGYKFDIEILWRKVGRFDLVLQKVQWLWRSIIGCCLVFYPWQCWVRIIIRQSVCLVRVTLGAGGVIRAGGGLHQILLPDCWEWCGEEFNDLQVRDKRQITKRVFENHADLLCLTRFKVHNLRP